MSYADSRSGSPCCKPLLVRGPLRSCGASLLSASEALLTQEGNFKTESQWVVSRTMPKLLHALALPLQSRAKTLGLGFTKREVCSEMGSHNHLLQGMVHKALCLGQMELLTWLSRTSHQITATLWFAGVANYWPILKSAFPLHAMSSGWKCRVQLCHPPPSSLGHQCGHTQFGVSVLAVTGAGDHSGMKGSGCVSKHSNSCMAA